MWFRISLMLAAILPAFSFAQSTQAVSVRYTGSVEKPAKIPATPVRVASLKVPQGFRVQQFSTGLPAPRMLAVTAEGHIYVSSRDSNQIILLRDTNNDGRADQQRIVARLKQAHGLTIHEGQLYVATVNEIFRANIQADGTLGEWTPIVTDLPDGGQHQNRTLAVGPDGYLYVSVGSTCNACKESSPESATMLRMKPDGSERSIYAKGLRNTIGFGWHPETKALWGIDHGMDWMGDDVPEELNQLVQNGDYGWPYVYANGKANVSDDPPGGMSHADYAKQTKFPDLLLTGHAAPFGQSSTQARSFQPRIAATPL